MATLRIREDIWAAVSSHLTARGEHFAFMRARWTWSQGEPVLWTTGVTLVPDELLAADKLGHEVPLASMLAAINEAVRDDAALIEVHNHRGEHPRWSSVDERGLDQVVPYMLGSLPGRPYIATVWSDSHVFGEWFDAGDRRGELTSVTVAGSVFRQMVSRGGTRQAEREETWSRQRPWFTDEGQRQLALLRVAIVGTGGTGSHVVQNLAFLGMRDFVLIDPDTADATSMNRLITGKNKDLGRRKVTLASRLIRAVAPNSRIQTLRTDLRHEAALDALRGCDLLFGCVDNDGARLVLNELAIAYELPYIDLATGIFTSGGRVTQAGGRVACVVPGGPCLQCMNEIDQEEAGYFLASRSEQHYAMERGYVSGMGAMAPSVVSINGAVAASAVNEFAIWFSGIRSINAFSELDLIGAGRGKAAQWLTPRHAERDPDCVQCGVAALGDEARLDRYLLDRRRRKSRTRPPEHRLPLIA